MRDRQGSVQPYVMLPGLSQLACTILRHNAGDIPLKRRPMEVIFHKCNDPVLPKLESLLMKSEGYIIENLEIDNCHGEQNQHRVDNYLPKVPNRQGQNQDKSEHPSVCQSPGPQPLLFVIDNQYD